METTNPAPDNESSSAATTISLPAPASTSPGSVRLQFGAQTHVGKVRSNNEDQYLVARACKSLDILATTLPGAGRQCGLCSSIPNSVWSIPTRMPTSMLSAARKFYRGSDTNPKR
jgi:hypothetical protein